MLNYDKTYEYLKTSELSSWVDQLKQTTEATFNDKRWGDLPGWRDALDQLPAIEPSQINLDASTVTIGSPDDGQAADRKKIAQLLKSFFPWRKGPYEIFGTHIDTEWRSDLKWDRFKDVIDPLTDKTVLDVGCGSGYHCWRMKGAGAKTVIGLDPTMLYPVQFQVFQKYIQDPSVSVFPIGIDDMPSDLAAFDAVFSMGLLYHRRAPLDHLLKLRSLLKEGGQLVLETLVIQGDEGEVLSPSGRYAKMPNVWFIPSCPTLGAWLKRAGFKNIQHIDTTTTTSQEQRATDWMESHSLAQFLDPVDPSRTCEGYPAPQRAVFLANI